MHAEDQIRHQMNTQKTIKLDKTKVKIELKNKNDKKKVYSRQGIKSKDKNVTKMSDSHSVEIQCDLDQIKSNKSNTTKFLSSQQASLINVSESMKQISVKPIKSKELDNNIKGKERKLIENESKKKKNFCLSKKTSLKCLPRGKTNFSNIEIDKPLLLINFIRKPKINPIDSFIPYDKLIPQSQEKRFFTKEKNYKNKIGKKIKRLNLIHIRDMVSSSIDQIKVAKNATNKGNFNLLSINGNSSSESTPELSVNNYNLLNNDAPRNENNFNRYKTEEYNEIVDVRNSLQTESSYVKKLASFWENKFQLSLPYKSDKDIWNLNIINDTSHIENKVEENYHEDSLNYNIFKFNEIMFTVNRLKQLLEKLPIASEENETNSKINGTIANITKLNLLKTSSQRINNSDSLQLYLVLEGLYGRQFDTTKPKDINEISAGIAEIIKKVSETIGIDTFYLCEEIFKQLNIPIIENNVLKKLNKRDNNKDLKKIKPFNKLIMIVILITITIFIIMFKLYYNGNKYINKEYLL